MHDEHFVQSSKREVREQTGRIQHHASIIFWDLNNEGEDLTFWHMKGNWTAYTEEYKSFYIDNLMTEYQKAGVNIAENFMDTSPSNGVLSFSPYIKRTGFSS